jgi:hypothetical protein
MDHVIYGVMRPCSLIAWYQRIEVTQGRNKYGHYLSSLSEDVATRTGIISDMRGAKVKFLRRIDLKPLGVRPRNYEF